MSSAGPVYVLFAGVNGAGKSTFYHTRAWDSAELPRRFVRVNPDDLAREFAKQGYGPAESRMLAGRKALALLRESLSARRSINRETTLTGKGVLKSIHGACEQGYRVYVNFIGLESPELALSRIRARVEHGGHDIEESAVVRRYSESIENLGKVVDLCEEVAVYDNTREFKLLLVWHRGAMEWWGAMQMYGGWLLPYVMSDSWHARRMPYPAQGSPV